MSKKESYWFSHDSNASNDPKLRALLRKYRFEGYGWYWRLMERLRECDDYRYDISMPFAFEVLADDLMMNPQEAEHFVRDCIDYFKLLETDGKYIWSTTMLDRMEFWETKKRRLSINGKKGAAARWGKEEEGSEEDTDTGTGNNADTDNNPGDGKAIAGPSGSHSDEMATPKPEMANETKLNETKPNKTIQDDTKRYKKQPSVSNSDGELLKELELLRDRALADSQRFVYPYVSTGRVNKEQLAAWLTAFNKWLAFTGEEVKTERDYRRHFAAWFRYRDTRNEDPAAFNPVAQQHTQAQKPPMNTMPLPVAIPRDEPKRKYSTEKKYDMKWLRNIRDEVRNIGNG